MTELHNAIIMFGFKENVAPS